MRKTILFFGLVLATVMAYAQQADSNGPVLAFAEERYEFGDIEQGEKVEYTFKFENTGNEPLIISNVMTTCGCTVPKWPREAIAPGDSGEIFVVFNSAGKRGKQNKVITVLSNASENGTKVSLTGNVVMPGDSN
jgi:hypothetical protein